MVKPPVEPPVALQRDALELTVPAGHVVASAPPSAAARMHTTQRAEKLTTDVIRRGAVVGRSDDEAAPGLWSKAGRYARRRPAIASGRAKPEKSIASGSKLNTVKIVKSHGKVRSSRGSARANMLS